MGKIMLVLGTFVLTVECGIIAWVMTPHIFYDYLLPQHGEPSFVEVYFWTFASTIIASLVPGAVVVWHLRTADHPWQFSLRTMFTVFAVMAVLLGVNVLLYHFRMWM